MSADFSSYQSVEDLDNVCVIVQGRDDNYSRTTAFFLTSDTSRNYQNYPSKVPLGNTVSETLNNLASYIKRYASGISDATVDGLKVEVTTSCKGAAANTANIYGRQDAGGTVTEYPWRYDGKGAGVSGSTSGGRNDPVATDSDAVPGVKAKLTLNLSDVESDSGFIFDSRDFRVVDPDETIQRMGVTTLTKGQPASGSTNWFRYSFDGNEITFEAHNNGAQYNNYSVNGNRYDYREPVEQIYDAYTAFNGAVETVQEGADSGNNAYWTMDLSGMTVDDFSQKYSGQYLEVSAYYTKDILRYKFYDSNLAPSINGFPEDTGSRESTKAVKQIDINEIRAAVQSGKTLAQAVNDTLIATAANRFEVDGDKVKILSSRPGTVGENDTVTIQNETLRHYDIDLAQLEGTVTIPDDLYGKGRESFLCQRSGHSAH